MNKDYILRMNSKSTGVSSLSRSHSGWEATEAAGWEVRPGGMLVHERNSDSNPNSTPVPNIKVKVKYGSSYHQVVIGSQASFGELKKLVAELTELNTQDQKLIFKEKERDSKSFLDICGVKNGSKIVLIEDELSKERRFIESLKNAEIEMASKQIIAVRNEVDSLANQVASIELEIKEGKKVVDIVLLNMVELLMTQLIRLDGIDVNGDVKLQRRIQVKRVQKYIETLDMLKMENSGLGKVPLHQKNQILKAKMFENQQEQEKQRSFSERLNSGPVVVTTE